MLTIHHPFIHRTVLARGRDGTLPFISLTLAVMAALLLIILIKSLTVADVGSYPLVYIYSVAVTVFALSRLTAALLYHNSFAELQSPRYTASYTPSVTFIIPCKNEGASIIHTVRHAYAVHYPASKKQVIVINDGSDDDTADNLVWLKERYPSLVVIHRTLHRGKRHAMADGVRRATGDIIVQLDSDSIIEPSSFRKLISPFYDPRVGAVCGNAEPTNAHDNVMTRMQTAYYFLSFRILKAAESTFHTVLCCSGCCSAYRKSAIMPILDEWLNEHFLGKPVTWGDDRALTNRVLAQDYKTLYADEVRVGTIVPTRLQTFLKQQLRWKKGWFVNSLFAFSYIFKRRPFVALTYFVPLFVITILTPVVCISALIVSPLLEGFIPLYYILGVLLTACIVAAYYKVLAREDPYVWYIFLWSLINMTLLSFILLFALGSIQNRAWGTR